MVRAKCQAAGIEYLAEQCFRIIRLVSLLQQPRQPFHRDKRIVMLLALVLASHVNHTPVERLRFLRFACCL